MRDIFLYGATTTWRVVLNPIEKDACLASILSAWTYNHDIVDTDFIHKLFSEYSQYKSTIVKCYSNVCRAKDDLIRFLFIETSVGITWIVFTGTQRTIQLRNSVITRLYNTKQPYVNLLSVQQHWRGYGNEKNDMKRSVYEIVKEYPNVICCGHSLGGGLCVALAATSAIKRMFTFGSPVVVATRTENIFHFVNCENNYHDPAHNTVNNSNATFVGNIDCKAPSIGNIALHSCILYIKNVFEKYNMMFPHHLIDVNGQYCANSVDPSISLEMTEQCDINVSEASVGEDASTSEFKVDSSRKNFV